MAQPTTVESISGGSGFFPNLFAGMGALGGLLTGVGSFTSSKELKEGKEPVDEDEILDAIRDLPIERWRYRADLGLEDAATLAEDDEGVYRPVNASHIGPYAEDVHERLGVGDGTTIPVVDAIGIGLAASKALAKRLDRIEQGLGLAA